MLNTQRVLRAAAKESLPVCVVMTKMDRLIVELRLPPEDAYFKIRHTLTEINRLLKLYGSKSRVSPSRGNVCFSSGVHMWSFTVQSMARLYAKRNPKINAEAFSKRLWGDTYVVTSYFFSAKNHSLTHSLIFTRTQVLQREHASVLQEKDQTFHTNLRAVLSGSFVQTVRSSSW